MQHVSWIVPTGHLSYAPLEPDSFYRGLRENPGVLVGFTQRVPHPPCGDAHLCSMASMSWAFIGLAR
jgi:hypothetical protein